MDCDGECLNDSDEDGVCDEDEIVGCEEEDACNYDPTATDAGNCDYPVDLYGKDYVDCDGECINDSDEDGVCDEDEIVGCEEEDACNYDPTATDAGNCDYPVDLYGKDYVDCDGECVNDIDEDGVCDEDEIAGCEDSVACNYNASATDGGVTCLYTDGICETCSGETDGTGVVVDNDSDNDEVCDDDEIVGCEEEDACNYDPAATDAGSCNYPIDLYGKDYVDCDGECLNDTDEDGVCDEDEIVGCEEEDACNYDPTATDAGNCDYPVDLYGKDYVDCDGECLNDIDEDGVCDEDEILGCTNPNADNYNPEATDDDGSCPVGCMWPDACNYDADALEDDGSCEFDSCVGCMDEVACNYDASATLSGACTYPELYQDCDGNCLNDADEDGVCDEIEAIGVEGCTDPDATNYNPNATDDDGSCYVYTEAGCTIPSATNYDPNVNLQGTPVAEYCIFPWNGAFMLPSTDCADPSACNYDAAATGYTECEYCLGCTDSGACNYDAEALYDDGSCSYTGCSGCTNACSSNYDDTAVIDDGSCDYANCGGCTDSEADNYDADATIDDGSCQYSGCTYPTSCNYDPSATIDDGSCSFLSAAVIGSVELVSSATSLISADGEISVTMDSGDPVYLDVTGLNGAADYAFAFPGTGSYGGMAPGYYSVTAVDASSCASEAVSLIVTYDLCCDCGVSDQDADGICDDEDNCFDRTSPNYNDPDNAPCIED